MNGAQTPALNAPELLSVNIPFQGFYESLWSYDFDEEQRQQVEYWQDQDGRESFAADFPELAIWRDEMTAANWDDLMQRYWGRCDFGQYKREVSQAYAEAFAWWLADSLDRTPHTTARDYGGPNGTWTSYSHELAIAWEFEELTSPRFYNFETDKIFAKFSLSDLAEIKARLDAVELEDMARERHTSRSGFCSFYSPDLDQWPERLEDWDYHQLGTLVRAWVAHVQGDNGERLEDELYEGLSETCRNLVSECCDWPKLRQEAEELAQDIEAEVRRTDPDFDLSTLPTPRCPFTLDLFAQEQRRA